MLGLSPMVLCWRCLLRLRIVYRSRWFIRRGYKRHSRCSGPSERRSLRGRNDFSQPKSHSFLKSKAKRVQDRDNSSLCTRFIGGSQLSSHLGLLFAHSARQAACSKVKCCCFFKMYAPSCHLFGSLYTANCLEMLLNCIEQCTIHITDW